MSKTLEFKAFCFEAYRAEKKLTGREAMNLFKKYGVLDYLSYELPTSSTLLSNCTINQQNFIKFSTIFLENSTPLFYKLCYNLNIKYIICNERGDFNVVTRDYTQQKFADSFTTINKAWHTIKPERTQIPLLSS